MPLRIEEDINGRLALDIREEPSLMNDSRFNDILLAFPIVSRTPYRIVVEVAGQVVDSLDYMRQGLELLNVHVALSTELSSLVERYHAEMNLIDEIRHTAESGVALPIDGRGLVVPGLSASAQLLSHQSRGLWRALQNQNLAEFSVQGAGKTAIVLSAFSIWKSDGEVAQLLVIGPVSCFQPWEDELDRCFGDEMRAIRWSGSISARIRLVPEFGRTDLILCSYDTAWRDLVMLRQLLKSSPTLLVLDESHYIKNFNIGARGSAMLHLAPYAAKRMILTGTPAPHSLQDLWTQFAFLWPNGSRTLLGNRPRYQEFVAQTRSPARELRNRLAPFYHRTNQEELRLPPADSQFIRLPSDLVPAEQSRIIRLLELRVLAEARLQLASTLDRQVLAQWQRARIIRLLQAASNPGLLLGRPDWSVEVVGDVEMGDLVADVRRFQSGALTSAKIQWVVDRTRQLVREGNKVVIWTWWVENLHLLSRLLSDLHPLLLYGAIKPYEEETDSTEEQSRERNIRDFRTRGDHPVLIANPAACAEAISLHRECHHAIYVDRTFNCGQFLQSLNRIHRIGLPEDVTTHYWIPILDCAVERSVDNRLRQRQRVMYEFLGDDTPVLGADFVEDMDVADNYEELNEDFQDVTREIQVDNH